MRVRRNPQASLYRPVLEPDTWGYDNTFTPNGVATLGAAADTAASAMTMLERAGTRGAVAIGATAGFLLSASHIRGALIGGGLGYLFGKYVVGVADKALAAINTVSKVEKATS